MRALRLRLGLGPGLGAYACAGLVLSVCASAVLPWPGQARTGGLVAAAPAGGAPTGLDHAAHARQVALSGAAAVPCLRCHAMDRRGAVARRPGHEACFGECHGPRPQRPRPGPRRVDRGGPGVRSPAASQPGDGARRAVCLVCHAAEALDRRVFAAPAGPLSGPEHALRLSHAAHDAPSEGHGGCRACHGAGEARPAAHARCTRCHAPGAAAGNRGAPAPASGSPADGEPGPMSMHECTRCHAAVTAGVLRPRLVPGPYRVSFSHARHQARGLDDCRGCHAGVLTAAGSELPAPRTEDCSGCHDGAQAFSVVGPHCRGCHDQRGLAPGNRPPRGPGYSHRAHQERGLDLPCARCHRLDARGTPLPPAPDHAPCSDAGCHREQFMARAPTICGACHVGTEPWLRLYFEPRPRPDTEFGARFSHRRHRDADIDACERCHRERSELRDMRLPHQHAACAGAGCHAQDLPQAGPDAANGAEERAVHLQGPVPLLSCTGCHVLDLVTTRHAQRIAAPWSVRARFEHAPHERDPVSGAAVACTACHAGVVEADTVAAIPGPPKRACAPCHDGRAAFKLTGHGCARCHGQAGQP